MVKTIEYIMRTDLMTKEEAEEFADEDIPRWTWGDTFLSLITREDFLRWSGEREEYALVTQKIAALPPHILLALP